MERGGGRKREGDVKGVWRMRVAGGEKRTGRRYESEFRGVRLLEKADEKDVKGVQRREFAI